MIKVCDLQEQYMKIRDEILQGIDKLCCDSSFIGGDYLKNFEKEFILSHKAKFGLGCSNGTSAILLALKALGIGVGDEVILPSHTFIATAEAICHAGAKPVFCDINPLDYTIDYNHANSKISKKTKAIIPVHIYGTPCDMNEILELADKFSLYVIEDCAQSHFAKYKKRYIGTFGDAGTFSFYPGKNMGAFGDAGFIFFNKDKYKNLATRLSNHGRLNKFDHEILGYNERMDPIQAVVLSIKLKYIKSWTRSRQLIASNFDKYFNENGFKTINKSVDKNSVYHIYNIEVSNRSEFIEGLKRRGISTGIHYPKPVHQMKPFSFLPTETLRITENISARIVSLPIYPELSKIDQEKIIEAVLDVGRP